MTTTEQAAKYTAHLLSLSNEALLDEFARVSQQRTAPVGSEAREDALGMYPLIRAAVLAVMAR